MGLSLDMQIAAVAIAPLLAGLVAPWLHAVSGRWSGWLLALVPAALFVLLATLAPLVETSGAVAARIAWVPSLELAFALRLDGLSLVFALTILGVGTFVVLYAGAYLRGHRHLGRFYGFLLAFMGSMLGLVLADNLLVLFGFWELTAVASFLLIGFDHARQAARRAAIQALVVTNIGGLALLTGAVAIHQATGQWDLSALPALTGNGAYPLILVAMLLAAFTKSAQVPFHFWLPNAMEAPTPVSAFLHSATMVQAGVYLLARLTPTLGGTAAWTAALTVFGGATLLWGAACAFRQTDLKQMLAQTTVASLGLLILLIGVGTEAAIAGMLVYFVAHALYKAGLFMIVGIIDHATGTRELTALGGLMRQMPLTFIAAALASAGMIGLPLTLGYLAKDEMYVALARSDWVSLAQLLVVVVGNGALGAVALAVLIRPFSGASRPTPIAPHEGSPSLLAGPLLLGIAAVVMALATDWFASILLAPAASAILAHDVESHLSLAPDFSGLVPFLSVLTWALGALLFLQSNALRAMLRRQGWFGLADRLFDVLMFSLIRFAAWSTRVLHHGRLELYVLLLFVGLVVAAAAPFLFGGANPGSPAAAWQALLSARLSVYEALVLGLTVVGLIVLLMTANRLVAILSLGVQGLGTAMIFVLFGAPDLALTQFMVEILSVVILALIMTRLQLDERDQRPLEDLARDGAVALLCGVTVAMLLGLILQQPFDNRLSEFFAATSVPIAHGRNIVNVILVDYRGLDTLGEISVVLGAGVAIAGLLRRRRGATP